MVSTPNWLSLPMLMRLTPWLLPLLLLVAACEPPREPPEDEDRGTREDFAGYRTVAQQRLGTLDQDIQALYRDTVEVAEERRAEFRGELSNIETEIDEITLMLEEEEPDDITELRSDTEQRITELEHRVEEMRLRITESPGAFRERAEERLEDIELMLDDLDVRLEGLDQEQQPPYAEAIAQQQERAEALRQDLEERIETEDFAELRDELAAAIADLRRDVTTLEQEIDDEIFEGEIQVEEPAETPTG